MRPDKSEPNHVNVVLDTIEVLAQNITKEDLIAVLTGKRPSQGQPMIPVQHRGARTAPQPMQGQQGLPVDATNRVPWTVPREAIKRPPEQTSFGASELQAKQPRLEYVPPTKEELEFYD